jgi:prevent-host-death family protein
MMDLTVFLNMNIIMTMIMVNIHEAKAKLSEYLEAAERGERVVICKRNQPVAELKIVPAALATKPRPIGGVSGIVMPPSFFDPLPDDLLDAFEGKPPQRRVSRVAERSPAYGVPTPPRKRRR